MCIRSPGIVMLVRVLRGGNAQQTQFRGAVLVSRIFRMSSLLTDARDSSHTPAANPAPAVAVNERMNRPSISPTRAVTSECDRAH